MRTSGNLAFFRDGKAAMSFWAVSVTQPRREMLRFGWLLYTETRARSHATSSLVHTVFGIERDTRQRGQGWRDRTGRQKQGAGLDGQGRERTGRQKWRTESGGNDADRLSRLGAVGGTCPKVIAPIFPDREFERSNCLPPTCLTQRRQLSTPYETSRSLVELKEVRLTTPFFNSSTDPCEVSRVLREFADELEERHSVAPR